MRGDPQVRLDRLRESANDGARNFRTVYTFYLVISLYILVIVSSTDSELLFRAGDVQMPIINAGVSVVWFFTVVPWILLILHFNLLIQAMFLSRKISQYISELDRRVLYDHERTAALGLLFPLPLAHTLADADRRWSTRILLGVMVFLSVAVLPPCILIYTQVQFLTYQEEVFVWLHRSAVVADIGLLWWLWPRIVMPDRRWSEWWKGQRMESTNNRAGRRPLVQCLHRLCVAFTLVVTVLSVISILMVADFPGGTMRNLIPKFDIWANFLLDREYHLSEAVLVSKEPSPEILAAYYSATCQSDNTGTSNRCDETAIDVGSYFWCKHAVPLELNKRHLRGADLSDTILCKIKLENTELHGVDLSKAELHDANLRGANLYRAFLSKAKLDGADLWEAKLSEATLRKTQLRGADLSRAQLDTAILSEADLLKAKFHGANLRGAELQGANLSQAQFGAVILSEGDLRGVELHAAILSKADLSEAKLHDADLQEAKLYDANLSEAELHDANLWGAELHGADLQEAELHGANLWGAELHGANLSGAKLHGVDLSSAKLHGADLSGAKLHGANLWGAELHGADLSGAEFHGANLQQAKLPGAQLTRTKLDLADLREIDLSSRPSGEAVRIIEEISDSEVRQKALERLRRSKDDTSVEPGSINGAVLCEKDALYAGLKRFFGSELPGDTLYVVQCKAKNKSNEYVGKLADELVSLACSDKSGYVAKGIAYRAISDWVLGPPLSRRLLSTPRCQGVTRGLEMLPEKERDDLGRIAARGIGASDP